MYEISLGKSGILVPTIGVGCMRINSLNVRELQDYIDTALGEGVNFFDHADIYGNGECEELFGKTISDMGLNREELIIQSKCSIVPGKMYDFSYEHIIGSVDGILQRLGVQYLDVLLLHRPDALMEPEEVAKAFDDLKTAGKVRCFGVSNQNVYQVELLSEYLDMPLCVNQLQFGIMHTSMIDVGINVNMNNNSAIDRDGGILDYCRLKKITIQPWSPMQYGFFEGCFIDNERFPQLNCTLKEIADKYGVNKNTVAFAWILRHPAKMQPITGTTNKERLKDFIKASEISLTKEEWYKIYMSAGNSLP